MSAPGTPEPGVRDPGRVRWERIRRTGKASYLLTQGVLRGLPMALLVIGLLEILTGADPARLRDPELYQRLVMAAVLFSAGGALSAWARWKGMEARYGDGGDA